jgi:hypothetical protein
MKKVHARAGIQAKKKVVTKKNELLVHPRSWGDWLERL